MKEAMDGISLRIPRRIKHLITSLAKDRDETDADARRNAMKWGAFIYAIMDAPLETGNYGDYTPEELAQRLRPATVAVLDFLRRNGEDMTYMLGKLGMSVTQTGEALPTQELQREARQGMNFDEETLDAYEDVGASLE